MELNPTQFFHGTDKKLSAGEKVVPAAEAGRHNFAHGGVGARGKSSRSSAYSTTSEEAAWHYADTASRNHGGRATVNEVSPHSDMQPGLGNKQHPTWKRRDREGRAKDWQEWAAPHFEAKGRSIDIKPGHQGTLNLNWKQFSRLPHADVNHPIPAEVESGHSGSDMYHDSVARNFGSGKYAKPRHEEIPGQGRLF